MAKHRRDDDLGHDHQDEFQALTAPRSGDQSSVPSETPPDDDEAFLEALGAWEAYIRSNPKPPPRYDVPAEVRPFPTTDIEKAYTSRHRHK